MIDFYYTKELNSKSNKALQLLDTKQFICSEDTNADVVFNTLLNEFRTSGKRHFQFAFVHDHHPFYLKDDAAIMLIAVFFLIKSGDKTRIFCAMTKACNRFTQALRDYSPQKETAEIERDLTDHPLWKLVHQFKGAFIPIDQPLLLESINIPKPWGQECWITGIEQRGQSSVASPFSTVKTPLPWLLNLLPNYFSLNAHENPILLKVLDPLPDEIYGDLYFEMHHQKQEVYVITNIDTQAWPSGIAKMRFGFNQQKLATYSSQDHFKAAFSQAVSAYFSTRKHIDELLDALKIKHNIALNDAISVAQSKAWLSTLPKHLTDLEQKLRKSIESFIGYIDLKQGDVIVIPKLTPHSLMHGVRCIEFQTPVYERQILFFAQKVLTQQHWDTDAALMDIDISHPQDNGAIIQQQNDKGSAISSTDKAVNIEKIVDFDGFTVFRYQLTSGAEVPITLQTPYCLLINIFGELSTLGLTLNTENACYISREQLPDERCFSIYNNKKGDCAFLVALPKIQVHV